jgi:hypothetical protein
MGRLGATLCDSEARVDMFLETAVLGSVAARQVVLDLTTPLGHQDIDAIRDDGFDDDYPGVTERAGLGNTWLVKVKEGN